MNQSHHNFIHGAASALDWLLSNPPAAISKFVRNAIRAAISKTQAETGPVVSDDTEAFGQFIDDQLGRLRSAPPPRRLSRMEGDEQRAAQVAFRWAEVGGVTAFQY